MMQIQFKIGTILGTMVYVQQLSQRYSFLIAHLLANQTQNHAYSTHPYIYSLAGFNHP